MEKKKLLLIGAGGHCKSCIDVIEQTKQFEIIGITDIKDKVGKKVLNYPIIGTDAELDKLSNMFDEVLITIGQVGNADLRERIFTKFKGQGYSFAKIISPLAYVSIHSSIEEGTIVMHNVIVNAEAKVGKNSIINTNVLIEHDAVVGDHCHIATGATINGSVKVGNKSFIGSGAVSKQGIEIPDESFIKANSIIK